jgi:hypothetical protein
VGRVAVPEKRKARPERFSAPSSPSPSFLSFSSSRLLFSPRLAATVTLWDAKNRIIRWHGVSLSAREYIITSSGRQMDPGFTKALTVGRENIFLFTVTHPNYSSSPTNGRRVVTSRIDGAVLGCTIEKHSSASQSPISPTAKRDGLGSHLLDSALKSPSGRIIDCHFTKSDRTTHRE